MSDFELISFTVHEGVGHLKLNRPDKRNAINDHLLAELEVLFSGLPEALSVIVLSGEGLSFCAGLDLSEHATRTPFEVFAHSRMWHRVFGLIYKCGIPIVSVLHGAVIGGGLELAASTHIRIADETAFYRLPEGQHGIFVGGGGAVSVGRILGVSRLMDMMLTGRKYDAYDGERLGLSHYVVEEGKGLEKAFEVASAVARNSKLANWAVITGLSEINSMSYEEGLFTESLIAGMVQTSPEAEGRIGRFLDREKTQK